MQPATGESIPPERRRSPLPAERRGRPPAPGSCPARIYAYSSLTSTPTTTSGFLTSTLMPRTVSRITPPTCAEISGDLRGKRLSERLPSTLNVRLPRSFSGRYYLAISRMASIFFSHTAARFTATIPNTFFATSYIPSISQSGVCGSTYMVDCLK